jgi:sugar fermentation stimulation protein A
MHFLSHIPPVDSGLYLLTLRVDSTARVEVGALGTLDFASGYYVYCGSARRGLSARLRRHAAPRKKKRWHIDYLTCRREVTVEAVRVFPVDELTECQLNERISGLPNATRIRGFGCSDCTCGSHLTYLGAEPPDLEREKNDRKLG